MTPTNEPNSDTMTQAPTTAAATAKPAKPLWLRLAPLAVVVIAAVIAWQQGWVQQISLENLAAQAGNLEAQVQRNFILTAVVFVALYAAVAGFPVAIFMSLAGGLIFGTWFGLLFNVTGATIGACIWFIVVKTAFGESLRGMAGGFIAKLQDGFNENAFNYLLTLRLIPAAPFSVVNIVASLLNMRLSSFAIATFIGIIPGGFVYSSLGNGAKELIKLGETPNLGMIFEPRFLIPLVSLGVLSLVPVIYQRFFKKKPA